MGDIFDDLASDAATSKGGATIGQQLAAKGQTPPTVSVAKDMFDEMEGQGVGKPAPPPKMTGRANVMVSAGGFPVSVPIATEPGQEGATEQDFARMEGKIGVGALTGAATEFIGPALAWMGLGGKVAEAAPATQKVGTGVLDQYGNEIFHDAPVEVKQVAANILQHPLVKKAIQTVVNGGKLYLAEEAGRHAGKLAGNETLGAILGAKFLGGGH